MKRSFRAGVLAIALVSALSAIGCGGTVDGIDSYRDPNGGDGTGSGGDLAGCTYGSIATVEGMPRGAAFVNGSLYVVATPPGPMTSSGGALWRIDSDGSQTKITDAETDAGIQAFGLDLGYGPIAFANGTDFDGEGAVDAESPSGTWRLDPGGSFGVAGITGNGNALVWQRLVDGVDDRGEIPELVHVTDDDTTPVVETFASEVTNVRENQQEFTDGRDIFMIFTTESDGRVLGVPPTDQRAKRILVSGTPEADQNDPDDHVLISVNGVDDQDVIYTTNGWDGNVVWSIPKVGGTPIELASYGYEVPPVLHDGFVYHLDSAYTELGAISRVPENGGEGVATIVTSDNPVNAFTFDGCGIVTLEQIGDETNATTNVVRSPLP